MIGLALLLAAATPADARADHAVRLFASLCASSRGSRGVAAARLGDGGDMGRRLTEDEVQALHGGRPGGMAWRLESPAGARMLLDYDEGSRCTVRVEEADPAGLRAAFDAAARLLAIGFASALTPLPGGGGYTYRAGGREVAVTLSSVERPADGYRHRMDFAFRD